MARHWNILGGSRGVTFRLLFVGMCLLVVAWAGSGNTLAAEVVHFKNGHVLTVVATRTDGNMVFIRMPEGGEIGVPASLIETIEGGRELRPDATRSGIKTNRAGRGIPGALLPGNQIFLREQAAQGHVLGAVGADTIRGMNGGRDKPMTFGYSYMGSVDVTEVNQGRRNTGHNVLDGLRAQQQQGMDVKAGVSTRTADPRYGPP